MIRGETIYIDDGFLAEIPLTHDRKIDKSKSLSRIIDRLTKSNELVIPILEAEPGHTNSMGVSLENNGCNIAIWSSSAEDINIQLYDSTDENKITECWRLSKNLNDESNLFSGFIPNMKAGDLYSLNILNNKRNFIDARDFSGSYIVDPYARAMTNTTRNNLHANKTETPSLDIPKCIVVDENYDWGEDKSPEIPENELVIYEGHVKGTTYLKSDIPENIRGKYSGIASDSFIKHLKKGGFTALQLMPVQHFLSEPHLSQKGLKNYWGYNTIGFFAPHSEYASEGNQVTEFKDMIKKLHSENIKVIMDVVYNHTPEGSEQGNILSFKGLAEKEMYHLSEDGLHCNYSGCGNTINASSEVGMNFILDSLRYWVEEMHVDGFRFDLATILAREQPTGEINMNSPLMEAIKKDPILKDKILIAEPWDCSDYRLGQFPNDWKEWNDQFRDNIRDFWTGRSNLGKFATHLACGNLAPSKSLNFITAHDGLTLADVVSYDTKHNFENGENNRDGTSNNHSYNFGQEGPSDILRIQNERKKAMRNMLLSLFTSPGTPMVSHGDEIMKTQEGNNNAYCQDNEKTWINWDFSEEQTDFYSYVSKLINIRKEHPVLTKIFNDEIPEENKPIVKWYKSDGREFIYNDIAWNNDQKVFGLSITDTETDDELIYYVNGSNKSQSIESPKNNTLTDYEILVDTAKNELDSKNTINVNFKTFSLNSLSSVLVKRKNTR